MVCTSKPVFLSGFPCGPAGICLQCGSLDWEDPLEKGVNGYPLQYSGLENSMDCIVCGVSKSQT